MLDRPELGQIERMARTANKLLGQKLADVQYVLLDQSFLGEGKPYKEILREAGLREIDLIVVGVHGRSALDRLVFGSTTEHLVRRATCPILTVRSAATDG